MCVWGVGRRPGVAVVGAGTGADIVSLVLGIGVYNIWIGKGVPEMVAN